MQAPQPRDAVRSPRSRAADGQRTLDDAAANDGRVRDPGGDGARLQDFLADFELGVQQPVPDWDWGPDEERRA